MPGLRLLWKKNKFPKGDSFSELLAYLDEEAQINAFYYKFIFWIAVTGLLLWAGLFLYKWLGHHEDAHELFEKTFPAIVWSSMVSAFSIIERENHRCKVFNTIKERFIGAGGAKEQEKLLEQMRETVWSEFFKADESSLKEFLKLFHHEGD